MCFLVFFLFLFFCFQTFALDGCTGASLGGQHACTEFRLFPGRFATKDRLRRKCFCFLNMGPGPSEGAGGGAFNGESKTFGPAAAFGGGAAGAAADSLVLLVTHLAQLGRCRRIRSMLDVADFLVYK